MDSKNILFVRRWFRINARKMSFKRFTCIRDTFNLDLAYFSSAWSGIERYDCMLDVFIKQLQLDNVHLTGKVTDEELAAYYHIADLMLCMSEHEGFSVPMIEAMHISIPVLAYNATSIPYTLDDAGVLINEKRYAEIAEMMDLLIENQPFREKILHSQQQRLAYFARPRLEQVLKTYIEEICK